MVETWQGYLFEGALELSGGKPFWLVKPESYEVGHKANQGGTAVDPSLSWETGLFYLYEEKISPKDENSKA